MFFALCGGSFCNHLLPLGWFSLLYSFDFMVVQVAGSHSRNAAVQVIDSMFRKAAVFVLFLSVGWFFSSFLNFTLFIIKAHECIHLVGDILLSLVQHFMNEIYITVIIICAKGTSRPRILGLFDEK